MKDFYTALQHCLTAIDLGIDLESCLVLYPEYEEQLRQFFQKWNGSRDAVTGLSERAVEQLLFDQVLDECIKAVGRGESPDNCYKRYPTYARRMRPWLNAVIELPRLRREGRLQTELTYDDFFIPEVPFTQALEEYIQAYRDNETGVVLARYPYYSDRLQFWADKIPEQPQLILPTPRPMLARRLSIQVGRLFPTPSFQIPVAIFLTLLLFLFSGIGLARAAAGTVPGQALYPLKLMVEQINLNMASDEQKAELKEQFADERRKEASVLIDANIKQDVAFDGQITSVDKDKVVVSDVVVLLNGLEGKAHDFAEGEKVHIEGVTGENGVVLKKINVHSLDGKNKTFVVSPPPPSVSLLPAVATSTPLTIAQKSATPVRGASIVSITATTSSKSNSPSEPIISPPPPPTSVPVPTSQPTKVPTSAPTKVPSPQPTAAPTEVPLPQPTVAPTEGPVLQPTLAPTEVPPPQPTAEPTEAPPEPTSAPTEANPPSEPTSAAPTDDPNVTSVPPDVSTPASTPSP